MFQLKLLLGVTINGLTACIEIETGKFLYDQTAMPEAKSPLNGILLSI